VASASLKRLLLAHELALVLLLAVTGGLGGLWAYFWHQTTEESVRIDQIYYSAQQIRGDLFRQIKEVYLARLMEEPEAVRSYTGYSRRIDEHFERIAERTVGAGERAAVERLRESYRVIQRDMNNIFADPYLMSRVVRVRILDPSEERNFVAGFEEAFGGLEALVEERRQALQAKMDRWTQLAPVLIAAPLVVAVVLVFISRRATQRALVQPMADVIGGARAMSGGDLGTRIPEAGVTEIRVLSRTMNEMAARLAASQEALLDAERQAAMGSLVPVVAHNIRNPLATIRATAQLMERCEDPAELREASEGIVATVDRLGRWVNSLVSYLHPLKPSVQRASVTAVLRAVADLLAERAKAGGVTLVCEPPAQDIQADFDPDLVEQAVYALLSNAVDASPGGGTVTVRLARRDGGARVEIADQGPGMPFEPEPRELAPGPSTKRFGTGLGIPLAFKICRAHGWQLEFEDARGGGTCAVICIPVLPAAGQ